MEVVEYSTESGESGKLNDISILIKKTGQYKDSIKKVVIGYIIESAGT